MGYTTNKEMVRVDFFKPDGKYYCTESVRWTGDFWRYSPFFPNDGGETTYEAFVHSLRDHFFKCPERLSNMTAVCIKPCHEESIPVMCKDGAWLKDSKETNNG